MNPNAKKWVAALRSGEYEQTSYSLQDDLGYCCLGVACAVYEQETGNATQKRKCRESNLPRDVLTGSDLSSQPQVRQWIGLNSDCGFFESPKYGAMSLTSLNDNCGCDFKEIADIIEAEAEELFVHEEGKSNE